MQEQSDQAETWKRVFVSGIPDQPTHFSQAAIVHSGTSLVVTSGFNSRDPLTGAVLHVGDVEMQTRTTLSYLRKALNGAGAGMHDVIKLTILYGDIAHMDIVRRVRQEFFPHNPPCATGYGVALPHRDLLIEIDAIAALPSD